MLDSSVVRPAPIRHLRLRHLSRPRREQRRQPALALREMAVRLPERHERSGQPQPGFVLAVLSRPAHGRAQVTLFVIEPDEPCRLVRSA